jgi:hypothetical protein
LRRAPLDLARQKHQHPRVYGGIHWRFDQVAGNDLGRAIATEVAKNHLRPIHP